MLVRKGSWQVVLCARRPSLLTGGFHLSPTSYLQRTSTACLDSAAAAVTCKSLEKSTLAEANIVYADTSLSVVLAAPSADVLAMRSGPATAAHETLRHALGTRDAYRIFLALLREQQTTAGTSGSELERLLSDPEVEADSLAAVVCACVAVSLSPLDWPPWVSARFVATGTASIPIAPDHAPTGTGKATGADEAAKGTREAWAAASPLRVTAAGILHRIASRLPSQGACRSASSPCLSLLKWLTLLCGVALAPSSKTALRLSAEAGQVSLDAAGLALATFCASHSLTTARSSDESAAAPVCNTRETWWLSLWMELTQPSTQPPSPPPFSLDAVAASPATLVCSSGLLPADLRKKRVSWHLHCLIASKEVHRAAGLLAGLCRDESNAPRGDAAPEAWTRCGAPIPVLASTQAELLSSLTPQLLEEEGIGEQLAQSLVGHLKYAQPQPQRPWSGSPQSLSFVPTVTANAVLYARMLQYLVASSRRVRSGDSFVRHLHDLSLLLSHGSIYALAASLVPTDQPLKVVMVAAKDTYREGHMQQLVGALRDVVDSLCEEPVPRLAELEATDAAAKDGVASTPRALTTGSGFSSHSVPPPKGTTGRRAAGRKELDLLERAAASSRGAASWHWREEVLSEVDGTVQAAVHLLTSLLELCSSRKNSLPMRTAEPKWRRELRERTAVRAHKFELLLQELPHAELHALLHTLLGHGYLREGSRLGVSLVKGDQVDLRYYTLPLLGSLYLAVSAWPSTPTPPHSEAFSMSSASSSSASAFAGVEVVAESEKQAVYRMYRRRLELCGAADLNVTPPSHAHGRGCRICCGGEGEHRDGAPALTHYGLDDSGAAATTALVCTPENKLVQALVLASSRPVTSLKSYATAELANCLLNRRVVVAGRGMVVDVESAGVSQGDTICGGTGAVFGPWRCTGMVTWGQESCTARDDRIGVRKG
ncbi:hypothetical protein GH5_00973 [Leishmania sp. Ghana 2012 LV757]|uniref:hypothetical protein n=1 Tax=Leishmania sp. Ghana 2012 LV757 TaxID=2803181 RepID=UPI001B67E6D3|nr:hypothetical protein GH5_00973 [Leishmania sp. Ghana 2012 LV757]